MTALDPAREDFWRAAPMAAGAAPYQEWQHFIVLAPGLDLVVNFSLSGATGRVIVLARTRRWHGFVDTTPRELSRDGCRGRFGDHQVEIRDGGYRISIVAPERGISIEAALRPVTAPITARRQALAPGCRLDWSLVARLAVDARVEIAGERFDLAGAVGYHDHNWGRFAWGDDFTWEWGCVLPHGGGDWAVVYSSLMNRARTELALEQLFVWRGPINVLAAGGADVRSRAHGRWRERPALRLPAPMALLHPRIDGDVPARFEATATNGADEIALAFSPDSVAQLLVPCERSLRGVVAIHECVGAVALRGRLGGVAVEWEGRGAFEFVR